MTDKSPGSITQDDGSDLEETVRRNIEKAVVGSMEKRRKVLYPQDQTQADELDQILESAFTYGTDWRELELNGAKVYSAKIRAEMRRSLKQAIDSYCSQRIVDELETLLPRPGKETTASYALRVGYEIEQRLRASNPSPKGSEQ